MEGMQYFYELYEKLPRGGPGDNDLTRKAYEFMTNMPAQPNILDIGCGPGEQTMELARLTKGRIIALDNHQPFLDKLMECAKGAGVSEYIEPKCQSMLEMDFEDGTFDIIWSEGALYFMGFLNGLKKCRELLKSGGYAAVTEVVYLKDEPAMEVRQFFEAEYPDIKSIDGKLQDVKESGLTILSHFTLPESCWLMNYYNPMEQALEEIRQKYNENEEALSVFQGSADEIEFYKRNSKDYGYEFFVMQKDD